MGVSGHTQALLNSVSWAGQAEQTQSSETALPGFVDGK